MRSGTWGHVNIRKCCLNSCNLFKTFGICFGISLYTPVYDFDSYKPIFIVLLIIVFLHILLG